ncbi:response regulator transcription factor [Rhizobacter sp. AJA081-3]|uniref:response regulator n=1 Tax=Rhizobacter sp. AJA081-3 TaxID=2753607 RepID=UPI001AE0E872|nr:response regulator transcription factor [Rhizobacter sp. AJA081-3]QTN21219.1 response regulator transcription factor [Rhizobacter sp. AJA081-3]
MIRVMLVDDHALVRMGFRMLLADAQVEVVAEFDTGEQACAEYARVLPDVVVMDLSMPGMGGLEAVRRLVAQDPKVRILALSAHEDTAHPQRVLRAGALGYLTKRSAPDALIAAVTAVSRHEAYVDAQTARSLAMAQVKGDTSPAQTLSEREFSVFIQLARGQSVAQIAENLKLSPSTVGTHLYHVKQKLGASNQSELTLVALQWGLIQI